MKDTAVTLIQEKREQGILVLALQKSFMERRDLTGLEAEYTAALKSEKFLVLDLTALDYIDSLHLAALVVLYKRAVETGCLVIFSGLRPTVRNTFQATRLDQVFTIASTRKGAVDLALKGGKKDDRWE
ncbi:MAG: STAS domain-containing protein [Candidatus Riflebacteria bacterium]|nr:STAS domain-containing protein [Candidatus Riflebacteria bacterium]